MSKRGAILRLWSRGAAHRTRIAHRAWTELCSSQAKQVVHQATRERRSVLFSPLSSPPSMRSLAARCHTLLAPSRSGCEWGFGYGPVENLNVSLLPYWADAIPPLFLRPEPVARQPMHIRSVVCKGHCEFRNRDRLVLNGLVLTCPNRAPNRLRECHAQLRLFGGACRRSPHPLLQLRRPHIAMAVKARARQVVYSKKNRTRIGGKGTFSFLNTKTLPWCMPYTVLLCMPYTFL